LIIFNLPEREKGEVLAAFGGWKEEVTAGSKDGLSIGVVGVDRGPSANNLDQVGPRLDDSPVLVRAVGRCAKTSRATW
jgi:hypothetical protein